MQMFNNLTIVFCFSLLVSSCSQTIKSPISGTQYKVNVGSTSDSNKYNKAREEAMKKDDSGCDIRIIECPDKIDEKSLD